MNKAIEKGILKEMMIKVLRSR